MARGVRSRSPGSYHDLHFHYVQDDRGRTAVIVRIWRTGIDMERAEEYDRFVVERSLPMFRRQPGLTAVYFTRTGEEDRAVVTVWADATAVSALDTSDEYQETTAAIIAAGFLRTPQTVELMPVDLSWPTGPHSHETS